MARYTLQSEVIELMTTYVSCIKPTMAQTLCLGDDQFKKRTTPVQNHLLFRNNLEKEKRRAPKPKKKQQQICGEGGHILVKNKGNLMYMKGKHFKFRG